MARERKSDRKRSSESASSSCPNQHPKFPFRRLKRLTLGGNNPILSVIWLPSSIVSLDTSFHPYSLAFPRRYLEHTMLCEHWETAVKQVVSASDLSPLEKQKRLRSELCTVRDSIEEFQAGAFIGSFQCRRIWSHALSS